MLKIVDRVLGWLLGIGGVLHGYGSLKAYDFLTPILVWALSATLVVILLAAINLVRAERPHDRTLAWISFAGCLCWAALAIGFGSAIGNLFDPRALYHVTAAVALAAFSLRTAIGRAANAPPG